MMNRLSHYFINGLIVLVPIVITYFVIATVFALVEGIVESYIPVSYIHLDVYKRQEVYVKYLFDICQFYTI